MNKIDDRIQNHRTLSARKNIAEHYARFEKLQEISQRLSNFSKAYLIRNQDYTSFINDMTLKSRFSCRCKDW